MKCSPRCSASFVFLFVALTACASGSARHEAAATKPDVTAEDLAQNPNEPIEVTLQRKVPGITVSRTADGGVAIRIRGAFAFDDDTAPLYLLNGLEIAAGRDGALPGINPFDIESIKVLKGADAGIYGIRGANGVIAITMKKPGKRP